MRLISHVRRTLIVSMAALIAGCAWSPAATGIPAAASASAVRHPLVNVQYATLDYKSKSGEALPTFLTGIRGDDMTGMFTTAKGRQRGFIYHPSTQQFVALDYPGAYDTTPYGPSFGKNNSLRAVGSYTLPNDKADRGFFYDGSRPKGQQFLRIDYPAATNTIPHSTFRTFVVGNWDKLKGSNQGYEDYPASGHGFIYDLRTNIYQSVDIAGAKSTTCYGVIDGAIAGGYTKPRGIHVVRAYVYGTATNVLYTYDHPGAVLTHFEGIAIAGRQGDYSLTGDWVGLDGTLHAFYIAMKNWKYQRPVEIAYPNGGTTSGNSVYTEGGLTQVIGVYNIGGGVSGTNGFVAYLH